MTMRTVCLLALTTALAGYAGSALANNFALILGNEDYRHAGDIRGADDARDAERPLRGAGFRVSEAYDLPAEGLFDALSKFMGESGLAERIVILLAGHFVQGGGETWFLGTDASRTDLGGVGAQGPALSTILAIAARAPGGAAVLLAEESARIQLGEGLTPGIGTLDIPQGVTVLRGPSKAITEFAARDLPVPGTSLADMAAAQRDILAEGYLGTLSPFLPGRAPERVPAPPAPEISAAERAFWQVTRGIGTAEAYEAYLRRYPSGTYAALARSEIARLGAAPERAAEAAEAALRLTRDQRREVQRNLGLLGHDPGGIDGVFGRGSRAAIARWQAASRFEVTSFLTREQVLRLAAEAQRRAAQLEAEAAARQAEVDRQDRQYWSQTGAFGDEPGLRAYLARYPDGLFADLATSRLEVYETDRRRAAAAQDRAAWDLARETDTAAGYRGYLTSFPRGAFGDEARARIAAIEAAEREGGDLAEAERVEAALNLPAVARNMVELRLDQLGLKPGPVDGRFDDDTRRAIRRFQRSRSITATGYLNQPTVVQLLSGGVLRFGD